MERKLKVGLIGLGGICCSVHMYGYDMLKDRVEIVAICDINPDKITSFKKQFCQVPVRFTETQKTVPCLLE